MLSKRYFSSRIPKTLKKDFLTVSQIIYPNQEKLLAWASGVALEDLRMKLKKKARDLPEFDWEKEKKQSAEAFKEAMKVRGSIGQEVHTFIGKILTTSTSTNTTSSSNSIINYKEIKSKEVAHCVKAFENWYAQAPYKVIEVETEVHSEKNRFYGRADCFALNTETNEVSVLDFKVKSNFLNFVNAMQCAAYALAYNEMRNLEPSSNKYCSTGIIIQIKYDEKKEKAAVVERKVRDLQAAEVAFHCRNLLTRLESNPKDKNSFSDEWIFEAK